MANEGTVQPSIATDESLTSGLIREGGGSGWSRVLLCIALCTSSLLFLSAWCLAAVTDSVAAPLLTVTTVGQANCDIKAPACRAPQREAPLTRKGLSLHY